MNQLRAERNEDMIYHILNAYEYETAHPNAADSYEVLLDNRELQYRCREMFFSNNRMGGLIGAYESVVVIDLAYLGQQEIEIALDAMIGQLEFTADDASYIEACVDATVNITPFGVYAYMSYPEMTVCAVIDAAHECRIAGVLDYHVMREIESGIAERGWEAKLFLAD